MTREEADRLIESINAQVDEPKPKWTPKKGELCEVWDYECHDYPITVRFHSFNDDGDFVRMDPLGGPSTKWKQYRKIQTPATRHEWNGGECPTVCKMIVIECRDGDRELAWPLFCSWTHRGQARDIVAYWELES